MTNKEKLTVVAAALGLAVSAYVKIKCSKKLTEMCENWLKEEARRTVKRLYHRFYYYEHNGI